MTVIAFCGKYLAADKMCCENGIISLATKLHKIDDYTACAVNGLYYHTIPLIEWYKNGAKPEDWPEFQKKDDWSRLVVVSNGKLFHYDDLPYPIPIDDEIYASGTGHQVALGVLSLGHTAMDAVRVASNIRNDCGMGVDFYEVKVRD